MFGKIPPALPDQVPQPEFRFLSEFRRLFDGRVYLHRIANQGDFVAMQVFEDLASLGRSQKLSSAIREHRTVVNSRNRQRGIKARRGDGTFGEIVPGAAPIIDTGYQVARGEIATVEIGVEVKVLAKAMIKQIDRVISDLRNQVAQFKRGGNPICIATVGINCAEFYVSWEGQREYQTTGHGGYLHPAQEAQEAERRLLEHAKPVFDEFIVLRFRASNAPPYPFEWANEKETQLDYGAILARISKEYDRRF